MQELLCAGGALATLPGCVPFGGGTCNANPDPCCAVEYLGKRPDLKPVCDAKRACEQQGGRWSDPDVGFFVDAGAPQHCIFGDAGVPDAGVPDAGVPDAGVPDAGVPDGGARDAGLPDAGGPDAALPDAH